MPHGFAYGTGCVLDHGKPPPRPAPIPCHPCALTYQDYAPNSHATPNPEGNDATRPEVSTHPFGSYGTPPVREYPPVHPFDYACRPRLRTRLTRDDERGPGTLGHPADGILTRLSLLMSAFSLPRGPRHVSTAASPHAGRSPTQQPKDCCRVFGGVLEPRYIVGAEPLDQ